MSELSYKELQEQGVFDVPYRAFKYMQSQQAKIDELQGRVDELLPLLENCGCLGWVNILKGKEDE